MMRRALLLCALLSLTACEGMFVDSKEAPLKGERVAVLPAQKDLAAEMPATPVSLPGPWLNRYWPQAGGYPNHAMGQLALKAKIEKAWSVSIGKGGNRREPLLIQPVVAAGTVYTLDVESNLTAFSLADGKKKWRIPTVSPDEEDSGALGGGIAFASGKIYVTNGYKQLLCINAADGSVIWRAQVPSPARAAPTVADDRVYLITFDNRLMVFSAADGMPLWSYTGVPETTSLLGSVSPAASSSLVVLPLASGEIFGLHPDNGQVMWEDNLAAVRRAGALTAIADIRGQPVIDQGVVYAASYSGRMVAIEEKTGKRLWQKEIGSAEMPWTAGPSVFVLTTEQQLVSLSRENGAIRWVTSLPKFEGDDKDKPVVWAGPVFAGGKLFVAGNNAKMMQLDPQTGKVLDKMKLSGPVMVPPLVADNTLLILDQSGELTAYR